MKFQGFGVSGFRSFGPDPQYIAPLEKVNIFAGRNNAGKSNVLRALPWLAKLTAGRSGSFLLDASLDLHQGARPATPRWLLPVSHADSELSAYLDALLGGQSSQSAEIRRTAGDILKWLGGSNGATWFEFDPQNGGKLTSPTDAQVLGRMESVQGQRRPVHDWRGAWAAMTASNGGSLEQHHVPVTLAKLAEAAKPQMPEIHLVDAHRQIGKAGTSYTGLNGIGLIARLLELQNPTLVNRGDLSKFQKINRFLEAVTGSPGARLEVPHSANELLVEIDGKVLPIESLGTGIQEVVIFAAAATAVDDAILCIEEPEIHLHPRLQRKLLAYLQDETSNQYFITTHSAHLLDAPGVALFHVTLDDKAETRIERLDAPGKRAHIGFDLGYRASDLVQANSIVWVEGPSDRIYVNAWLKQVAPALVEGMHYSVMFYGGRLLSHLSGDDGAINEFISLQRLNRQVAILIDSDMRDESTQLNATKTRVIAEIRGHGGFAWITAGREVENYLPAGTRDDVLAELHPTMEFVLPATQWDCCYEPSKGQKASVDKIALAKRATSTSNDLSVLDLDERIGELAAFIRRAND